MGGRATKLDRLALEEALRATTGVVRNHPDWKDRPSTAHWVRAVRAESAS